MSISDDTMLRPFRQKAGLPCPGDSIGGWYDFDANYDGTQAGNSTGFAPGHCFGQWLSALARAYAITGSLVILAKVKRLLAGYSETICGEFYENFRFPAYTYDKLVGGLLDVYELTGDKDALQILDRTTDAALPNLPPRALNRGEPLPDHPERDPSFGWDESYTLPENLLRAYELGAGERYKLLATRFLLDKSFFDKLAAGENVMSGQHAYSFMNALSSAMRAYLTLGSEKHLLAARNAFRIVSAQSFATGGWGPEELFVPSGGGHLGKSLETTHHGFEICGGYAHMKLTRYLLQLTGDSRYADSMERVIYNTVLGAKPLKADGSTFYYCDYSYQGHKDYYWMKCPCCAGTLPQITADYRLCTYFLCDEGPIVNLFIPSTLTWTQNGTQLSLSQESQYPFDERIDFTIATPKDIAFTLRLRIPAWVHGKAELTVNGQVIEAVETGDYACIHRIWRKGDRISLKLPMGLSLEPVDAAHGNTLALSYGPLTLLALLPETVVDATELRVTRNELLNARRESGSIDRWQVKTKSGWLTMAPFVSIENERYSTYLRVSDDV